MANLDNTTRCSKCHRRTAAPGRRWCSRCSEYWKMYRTQRYANDPVFREKYKAATMRRSEEHRAARVAAGDLTCVRCGRTGPGARVRRHGSGSEVLLLCTPCRRQREEEWRVYWRRVDADVSVVREERATTPGL